MSGYQWPKNLGQYKGVVPYVEDLYVLGKLAPRAARRVAARAWPKDQDLGPEPVLCAGYAPSDEDREHARVLLSQQPQALPDWAEELRGCELPHCPVCALARRGYQEPAYE